MTALASLLARLYCAFLIIGGIAWAVDLPFRLGFSFTEAEWLSVYVAVAIAAVMLKHP